MGTPEFAVPSLQKLITITNVVGVVTQPDRPSGRGRRLTAPPVKAVALAAGIPVYQPESLRSEEAVAHLANWQPDLIVVAAFGQILRPPILDLPPKGSLNVHASLLPRWRGASPIQHAILAGDRETGVSLMQMDEGMDTGPIFVQRTIPLGDEETAATLHDRLAALGAQMLDEHLGDILAGRLRAADQDNQKATYAPLIRKQDGAIDWNQRSAQIERHIRAMTPWPGAYTTWHEKNLKVLAASIPKEGRYPTGKPGQIVSYGQTAVVLTGDGAVQLDKVQLAGKRATSFQDFLLGRPDIMGNRLGN